jgi:hypothetical protein
MKKKKKVLSDQAQLEKHFPNAEGRKAGDLAIDALGLDEDMIAYLDAWEAAYYAVAKKSPYRKGKS